MEALSDVASTRNWLEVHDEHDRLLARHELGTDPIALGRALDNDVVLDDPHVAGYHARVQRDASGSWVIENLDSRNGLARKGKRKRETSIPLDAGTTVCIGRCRTRLRSLGEPLPAERPLGGHRLFWWLGPGGLVLVALLLPFLNWLGGDKELKASFMVTLVITSVVMLALWALLWGGINRIFAPRLRYLAHLAIGCGVLLADSLWEQMANLISYAFSWVGLSIWSGLAGWVVLGAGLWLHLRTISRRHPKAHAWAAIGLVVVACGLYLAVKVPDLHKHPQTLGQLAPPALRLASPIETGAFFKRVDALQADLKQSRAEKLADNRQAP